MTRKPSSLMLIVTVTSQKFKWIVYPSNQTWLCYDNREKGDIFATSISKGNSHQTWMNSTTGPGRKHAYLIVKFNIKSGHWKRVSTVTNHVSTPVISLTVRNTSNFLASSGGMFLKSSLWRKKTKKITINIPSVWHYTLRRFNSYILTVTP